METTRCFADENLRVWQQSKLAWKKELQLAKLKDKKAEQAFLLEMKQMELLKEGIFVLLLKKQKDSFYQPMPNFSFLLYY